jgi:hypothetical protein
VKGILRMLPFLQPSDFPVLHARQLVVSVTNRVTLEQAWFNEVRTRKPQTFTLASSGVQDPTQGGLKCDFCQWELLTAEDEFGRIELAHAVTGSNLFKYAEPCHGLTLFKAHDPLVFSLEQLSDFMSVSEAWFAASHKQHPDAKHAFLIWNCLARAGVRRVVGEVSLP